MHQSRSLSELKQLLPADVRPIILGVAVHKHGKAMAPEKDDGSIARDFPEPAIRNCFLMYFVRLRILI
jgi:hypothetical protein